MDKNLFVFMEYCDQGDLQKFLKAFKTRQNNFVNRIDNLMSEVKLDNQVDLRLDEQEARFVIQQVAEGLSYLN